MFRSFTGLNILSLADRLSSCFVARMHLIPAFKSILDRLFSTGLRHGFCTVYHVDWFFGGFLLHVVLIDLIGILGILFGSRGLLWLLSGIEERIPMNDHSAIFSLTLVCCLHNMLSLFRHVLISFCSTLISILHLLRIISCWWSPITAILAPAAMHNSHFYIYINKF